MRLSSEEFADRLVVLLPELMQEISRYENNYVTRGHITCQQFTMLDLIAQQEKWMMRDFVHSTGLTESIREDDEVTFDLEEGKKGLNAVNVKLA